MEWVCEKHGHQHDNQIQGADKSLWFPVRVGKPTQVCPTFIQGMADRMAVAFHRYGDLRDAPLPPHHIDELAGIAKRVQLYEETGNGEYMMDAANFAMIEYMLGFHPEFNLTPVEQGPGLQLPDGTLTRKTHLERKQGIGTVSGSLARQIEEGRSGD